MENNNINTSNIYNYNKTTNRFKSVSNIFTNKLSQFERSNSNINSSTSKKTAGFEESLNYLTNVSKKMNSFSNKKDVAAHKFSKNLPVHQSQEFSMKDIKDKNDVNGNYTNINISIVNPNFSINNYENSNANLTNKRINMNLINNTLLSFKENNNILVEDKSVSKNDGKAKMIASIYKDFIENKSNEETFSENFKDERKKNMFRQYIIKNKVIQYEFNAKGIIAGVSAYMYPNEEKINKDKICLNININKLSINENENINNKGINFNSHIVNFFSLFSGGEKDTDDELPKYLKNQLKDFLLKDQELITNPQNAIKNSFIKCELDFIKKYLEEKISKQNNTDRKDVNKPKIQIPSSSIFILLNIDDMIYIGNIGDIESIISNNNSKDINYILKDNTNKEIINSNNSHIFNFGERKSVNSLFNYNNINDEINIINNINDQGDVNNSQMFFDTSNINLNMGINQNNINTINNINSQNNNNNNFKPFISNIFSSIFIRTFPGKTLYDFLTVNNTVDSSNNANNKNINSNTVPNSNSINSSNKNGSNKKYSKNKCNRRLSTTFNNINNFNSKNKAVKVNNYMKDNMANIKSNNFNFNTIKGRDSLFNLGPIYNLNSNQNYNKFYRKSFMSQNTYNDIFPEHKIISSYPDIVSFQYQKSTHDFILIGVKIIFEKLTVDKICKGIYETMKKCIKKHRSFEIFLGCVVKDIIKKCLSIGITSNISCLFICFESMKQLYIKRDINAIENILVSFYLTSNNTKKHEMYNNFISVDFIDLEKASEYNNLFSKEIEKMNKIKNHFSTNIINTSEINKKINENSMIKRDEYNKVKQKIKSMNKKCCCFIF